jgi:hypothetical protein
VIFGLVKELSTMVFTAILGGGCVLDNSYHRCWIGQQCGS